MTKKMERRKKMVAAARKLFADYGFEKTTMQNIADEASVGVATVFRYFPKKEYLIIEVVKNVIEEQVPYFEKIISTDKKGIDKIDDVLTQYIQYTENRESAKLLEAFEVYIAFVPTDIDLLEEINRAYGKISSIIYEAVKEGKRDGSIKLLLHDEIIANTVFNIFGTAVKKYSLYTLIPQDAIITVPKKEQLVTIKNIMLSYIKGDS